MNDLEIIILGAGKGTRMGDDQPKVLTEINGRPMIAGLLASAIKFLNGKPILVLGYKAEEVKKKIGNNARYVIQTEQLGTGHAVRQALPEVSTQTKHVMVFYGDHPLIDTEVIETIYNSHIKQTSPLTMVTLKIDDYTGWQKGFYDYGRVIRDKNNKIVKNVEKKDASAEELVIKEVSPSFFCFDFAWLKENISKIKNMNTQKEFYLPDLVSLAREQGFILNSCTIPTHKALGVNTREQLALVLPFMK